MLGRRLPCALGRGGIKPGKCEGDGATPAGTWSLVAAGWRPDRIAPPPSGLPLRPIGPPDIWSDDPADPAYNHWLRANGHAFGHERLRRADPLYDLVLISDWNWPRAVPGQGSAIFVHAWRRPRYPTAGCIAFSPADLRWVLAHWQARTRVFVGGRVAG